MRGNKTSFGKIIKELGDFVYCFGDLATTFFFFLPDRYRKCFDFITENEKFEEYVDTIKQCFVADFIRQLERIMQKSEIY